MDRITENTTKPHCNNDTSKVAKLQQLGALFTLCSQPFELCKALSVLRVGSFKNIVAIFAKAFGMRYNIMQNCKRTVKGMIIDFHTHAFPDTLAHRALDSLKVHIDREPLTDGTLGDLVSHMKKWGVDLSVVCNIATNARQTDNVNTFAIESAKEFPAVVPLGSVHPQCTDAEYQLSRICSSGLPGIKLHPDYMGYDIDDPIYDEIFELCSSFGLFVIIHAGLDVCSPRHIHATPDMILHVIERHPSLKLVCAHFGANLMWDEVLEKLCGKPLWIDTSLALVEEHDKSVLRRILLSHDSDRILFASDCPWCPPDKNLRFIESLASSSELCDKIFEKNAKHLLYK